MGRQSEILATNIDLLEIEQILRGRGDVDFLSKRTNEARTTLLPLRTLAIEPKDYGGGRRTCYLAPNAWVPQVELRPLSDVKVDIGIDRSELIELVRPYCADGEIQPNRIYYTTEYLDDGALRQKSREFVTWAESVMKAVRRSLTYDKARSRYVGADAVRRVAAGELKIIA